MKKKKGGRVGPKASARGTRESSELKALGRYLGTIAGIAGETAEVLRASLLPPHRLDWDFVTASSRVIGWMTKPLYMDRGTDPSRQVEFGLAGIDLLSCRGAPVPDRGTWIAMDSLCELSQELLSKKYSAKKRPSRRFVEGLEYATERLRKAVAVLGGHESRTEIPPLKPEHAAILEILAKEGTTLTEPDITDRFPRERQPSESTVGNRLSDLKALKLVHRPLGQRAGYAITEAGRRVNDAVQARRKS